MFSDNEIEMLYYAIRDMIAGRNIGGRPVAREFYALHQKLVGIKSRASVGGSEIAVRQEESTHDELIGTTAAAKILNCSPRWVRDIRTDLDGQMHGGRWLFRRSIVVEYAEGKG